MNVKQKQWQLHYLGFLPFSEIDGYAGPKTQAATATMQEHFGIGVDGIFGNHTRNMSKSVVENIQRVIRTYATPALTMDGLAGPATVKATKAYQEAHGLPVTGLGDDATRKYIQEHEAPEPNTEPVPEPPPKPSETPSSKPQTGTFWDDIKYFTRQELRCKCGGRYCNGFPAEPKEMMVRLADRAREHFGKPAHNVSCLRCSTWNAISKGVANSQHMYGEAMDIRIDGVSANDLYSFLKKQPEVRYTYKINSTNVHFDIQKGPR